MPGWGHGWGFEPWGGGQSILLGESPPYIVYKNPEPNAENIAVDAMITIAFDDPDNDLDSNTIHIWVNNIEAYEGSVGFQNGFVGQVTTVGTTVVVQLTNPLGWDYGKKMKIQGYAADTGLRAVNDIWYWHVLANPRCYNGLTPLPIELSIQQPLERFLEIELIRKKLFDVVVNPQLAAIPQRGNKAARVIYQTAYGTDLSTVLNSLLIKNEAALIKKVCERERISAIDTALAPLKKHTKAGITSLLNEQFITSVYVSAFNDYLDSTLYYYRVSLAANLVILGKALELAE